MSPSGIDNAKVESSRTVTKVVTVPYNLTLFDFLTSVTDVLLSMALDDRTFCLEVGYCNNVCQQHC